MTLLVVSPDYASHLLPLLQIARRWLDTRGEVVVATGPATRAGPIATLTYQADARRHDLLYDPDGVLARLGEIVRDVRPERVVVDHVAFGARLALHAIGVPAVSVVLGHPSALPAAAAIAAG